MSVQQLMQKHVQEAANVVSGQQIVMVEISK